MSAWPASSRGLRRGPLADGPDRDRRPRTPTYSVTATVFYDENGNGQLDPNEVVRIPGVEVVIGSGTGDERAPGPVSGRRDRRSARARRPSAVRTESLPSYFQPGTPVPVQVPGTARCAVPLTLPIGHNNPNVYFGYGDSITAGDGSSDEQGYRLRLQNLLGPYFGRGRRADLRPRRARSAPRVRRGSGSG